MLASVLAVAGSISTAVPGIVPPGHAAAQQTETQQPLAIEGPTTVEFPENSTAAVATYQVTNAAADSTISWSIDGTDARRLSVDGDGVLRFKAAKDYEKPNDGNRDNEYEIGLSATDGSMHASVDVIVRVTNVNEPPAFELENAEFSVEENASANRRVGRALVVSDPDDGDSRTFSVEGEDADLFHIDAEGQIRVLPGAVLDYEAAGVFNVTALVTDVGGLSDSLPVQISLTDADDPGMITFSSAGPFVGVPFTATVSDQDGVTGRIRWRWYRATSADDEFRRIDGATRSSYTPVEDDEGYLLRVTVSYDDNFEVGASASGTSAAVGRNAAPQYESASINLTVPEETPAGTSVGDPVSATDGDGDDLVYALSGEDASYFAVNASTGQITVGAQALPDSETKGSYTMIVTATDEAGATASITVMITVSVPNAPPVITGPASLSYAENGQGSVATYSATDPEGDGVTWSVAGTDAARFGISETGELSFNVPPDFEDPRDANKDNMYEVTVTASDGSLSASLNVEITVTNVNEFGAITGPAAVSYAENGTTAVATYSATDPDGDGVTWNVAGMDATRFGISETGELSFNSSPDFEDPRDANNDNVYEVTVTASDGNLSATLDVEITVTNVNETASITGPAAVSYAENSTTTVTTYSATDPENDGVTWGVAGTDAARFSINTMGELSFNSSQDYEDPRDANKDNIYEVVVTASDGNLTATLDVEVTVTNVNESGTITGPASVNYAENGQGNVATYSATDPESDSVTWGVGGTDAARFEISESGELSFNVPPDFENPRDANKDNVYEVTVTAFDGDFTSTLDVTVAVTNVNESASITGPAAVSYVENSTTAVATYSAADPEGDGVTWSVAGTDAARFGISETGELSFNMPPDFEDPRDANKDNVYEVTVTASDGNLSTALDVEVTVTDVNEAASITGPASVNYAENGTASVATYSATDPESDGITWGVAGTDAARFSINTMGELSFNVSPDFEDPRDANKDNVHEVTVTASDGNLSSTLDVEITVTNVNESTAITGPASVSYAENGTTVVAMYSANDPEGDGVTWGVSGTDAACFSISATGELSFNSSPDFESPRDANKDNVYEVSVTASDGNLSSTLDVEITVTNVNEAGTITGPASVSYAENGTDSVATYTATDPESNGITWSVTGTDAARFGVSESGELSFNSSPDYEDPRDANEDNVYEVTVTASDGNLSSTLDVEITVTNVNESAAITGPAVVNYAENGTAAVAMYSATDPEGGGITWVVTGVDAARFSIGESGELSFDSSPDFENPRDANRDNVYEVMVTASDGDFTSTLDVTVAVTNVNEPPTSISGQTVVDYRENGVGTVATYTADDPEGDGVTWGVSGTDADLFDVDQSGRLTFRNPPNFEVPLDADIDNTYEVRILAGTEPGAARLDVAIDVSDANDAPRFPSGAVVTEVPENSCPGAHTLYRGIGETDEDGDPLTYVLAGPDAQSFVIHPPTGSVTLGPGTFLDFEVSREPFMLRLSVSDGRDDVGNAEGAFVADDSFDLTVAIADVNEPPVFTEARLILDACGGPVGHEPGQLHRTVVSGARGGSPVGARLSTTDPEGEPVRFRIVSQSDQGAFGIDGTSGQIMVAPDFSPRDARRVYTLRVAATDGELESQIEVRIAVERAPKPVVEPEIDTSRDDEPDSESDDPSVDPEPDEETGSESTEIDGPMATEDHAPERRVPLQERLHQRPDPEFVPVPGAAQVPRFAAAEVSDEAGRVRLTAPAATFPVPYQVRLMQDEVVCSQLLERAELLTCVSVSVEFFDVEGVPFAQESLSRSALLEIILRMGDGAGTAENGDARIEVDHDSVGMIMRQNDEQEWSYTHADLREPADGSLILAARVRSPGQYIALVTETGTEREASAGAAPMNFLKTAAAQQYQSTAGKSAPTRTVPFVYDSLAAHPQSQPVPIVSAEPQAWRMARLLIALLLDVTVALSAGFFLQRITFRSR